MNNNNNNNNNNNIKIIIKGYVPNLSEEVYVIQKVKNTVPWTYVINDRNEEEIVGTFFESCKK